MITIFLKKFFKKNSQKTGKKKSGRAGKIFKKNPGPSTIVPKEITGRFKKSGKKNKIRELTRNLKSSLR